MTDFSKAERTFKLSSGKEITYFSLKFLEESGLVKLDRLPYSVKVLLESLVRMQPHAAYEAKHITDYCGWDPKATERDEFPYMPSRVLLQDFTGVPCVVDLAALRSALDNAGYDPTAIEPQIPVDLVIDHSVQIDEYRGADSIDRNLELEFERNHERYVFLRWGQGAFGKLRILPPGLGICHQVNMEYLASCVGTREENGKTIAFPDTLVGTDSHTTMINSMGVLGWGVGGIEAEAAMLGQPIPILTPKVVGCRLVGKLAPGAMPTDVALEATRVLREKGCVGQFVEYFGPALAHLTVADRAPISNMSPEYGATMGFFPIDANTVEYLRMTGRDAEHCELVEAYCRAQGLWRGEDAPEPEFTDTVEIDLSTLVPSLSGPKRPQDKISAKTLHTAFREQVLAPVGPKGFGEDESKLAQTADAGEHGVMKTGDVVIASITSCTNTSNPSLLIGAGLVAKKAVEFGLKVPSYVKTSLAPGSRVVTQYLKDTGLMPYLNELGFHVVAYGCTTCIGNSGPLLPEIEAAIDSAGKDNQLLVSSVVSGNRNFEGRIHPLTQANYLASPPLVVAYALRGNVGIDLYDEPLGQDNEGNDVFLKDIWPTHEEINALLGTANNPDIYNKMYEDVVGLSPTWNNLPNIITPVFEWDDDSTYIREPSFFDGMTLDVGEPQDITGASALLRLGDFITTDHISPAGKIPEGPAMDYLTSNNVAKKDLNSFGSRRGNHEVMMRGTFANIRISNQLVDMDGGWTIHHPTGDQLSVFDAAARYRMSGTPLVVIAGENYGAGSSRDWAAKGTFLLGCKAVIAKSFERIHRSNLVQMAVLPLEFTGGADADSLGLDGTETWDISGVAEDLKPGKILKAKVTSNDGSTQEFDLKCRIDSAIEVDYFRHGGILHYVLRDVMNDNEPVGV